MGMPTPMNGTAAGGVWGSDYSEFMTGVWVPVGELVGNSPGGHAGRCVLGDDNVQYQRLLKWIGKEHTAGLMQSVYSK